MVTFDDEIAWRKHLCSVTSQSRNHTSVVNGSVQLAFTRGTISGRTLRVAVSKRVAPVLGSTVELIGSEDSCSILETSMVT